MVVPSTPSNGRSFEELTLYVTLAEYETANKLQQELAVRTLMYIIVHHTNIDSGCIMRLSVTATELNISTVSRIHKVYTS